MNIGIFGTSYCGSTLLSYIFTKHSKIFSVGESHWLIDKSPRLYPERNYAHCNICKDIPNKTCDFYTPDFIQGLTQKNLVKSISDRVKEKYNIDKILYSDKNTINYNRLFLDANQNVDKAIVLFKRPEGFLHSFLRHDAIFHKNRTNKEIFELGVSGYKSVNRTNQEWIKEHNIPVLYIFLEDFTKNPEVILKNICKFLEIPYEKNLTKYWENNSKFHQIGGNGSPKISIFSDLRMKKCYNTESEDDKWYRSIKKTIKFDQRWKIMNKKYLIKIQSDVELQNIFINMLKQTTYQI